MLSKKCIECGKEFEKKTTISITEWRNITKFCSRKCYLESRRRKFLCEYCGEERTVGKDREMRFCSVLCSNRWKTENGKTGFFKGHKGYVKDYSFRKPMTQEVKDKISKSNTDNPKMLKHLKELNENHRGENHWNWKGGIARTHRQETKEYREWRSEVYARDNWTCQKCGEKQKHPIAHHKKSWKDHIELRYEVSNGITVCRKCHKIIHKEIGLMTRFK